MIVGVCLSFLVKYPSGFVFSFIVYYNILESNKVFILNVKQYFFNTASLLQLQEDIALKPPKFQIISREGHSSLMTLTEQKENERIEREARIEPTLSSYFL